MERRIALACVAGVLVFMSVVRAQDPRGTPGVDYPNYFTIPETSFKCSEQKYNPGFYADLETKCQAFHFCYQDRMESFLCPTGTIFNQAVLTCDVWYKSNCSLAQMFYSVNAGPIMERAGKNLPMLLRLRNRSHKKPSEQTSTASVFDKVSSLYGKDNETPDTFEDKELTETGEKVKSSPGDFGNQDYQINPSEFDNKYNEQMIADNHELDSEIDNVEETDKSEFSNEVDEMDANLVYDNTGDDSYYNNYRQYEEQEWQNSEPVSEQFGNFYDYRGQNNEDAEESAMDYVNGESVEDEDLTVVEDSDFAEFKKRSQSDHSRNRRKPMYVVLDDQPRVDTRERTEITEDIEMDSSMKSEIREAKQTNLTEVEESTQSPDPFPRPTAIPHSQLNISSEAPMTSEEFESAIWSDVVLPGVPDDYEGPNLVQEADDNQGTSVQSEVGSQSDAESDDETIYIENDLEPESYESYDSQYEDVIVVPEPGDEPYVESYSESAEKEEADSSDTEDTFVLIPDEYDNTVVPMSGEDFEVQNYPEETVYGNQMLADRSPVADYDSYRNSYEYENAYTPNVGYPHYQQDMDYNPEMTAEVYQNVMPNDQRYDYERDYETPQQLSTNYESSNFESENTYSQSEYYPYAEREASITERPQQLPVTEADFDSLPNEDFVYVLEDQPEETWKTSETQDKQMNLSSEPAEEATPSPILSDIQDDVGQNLISEPDNQDTTSETERTENQSGVQNDDENIYIKNDVELPYSEDFNEGGLEPEQSDVYFVLDSNEEQSDMGNEMVTSEDESAEVKESQDLDKVDEQNHESNLVNSSDESSSTSNKSLDNEKEQETVKPDVWSPDLLTTSENEPIKSSDSKTTNTDSKGISASSNLGKGNQMHFAPETLTSQNNPYSNMGGFDFSTDSRFLNNMGYSESMDFGPYGFGPNMGQFSMMESMQQSRPSNPFSERMGQMEQNLSPLSAIQEKMRSMKQGKFGAFKKYMSSTML